MQSKPKHLGPEYAAQFQDAAIVAAYPTRPPYPDGVFETLAGLARLAQLAAAEPRTVLDVGCGTGDVARRLAPLVDRLDAMDVAERMIALGKTLPGGDAPNLRWIAGRAEDAPLEPPYALISAGESLHWMDWPVVMRRFRAALAPGGYLALTGRGEQPSPWSEELLQLIVRYSTNKDFRPYDLMDELESRGLFKRAGERMTAPVLVAQPVETYIESIHSRNGFSRDRMLPEDAHAFDTAVRELVAPYAHDGLLRFEVVGNMIWGEPGAPD